VARVDVQLDAAAMYALLQTRAGPVGRYLFQTGKMVESVAKRNVNVDTGRLRSSITTGLFELPHDPHLACRVGTDVDYATYVHEGTVYMSGNPYLEDALREVVGD
jgi:hypothetical protein